ncbi:glycoside hydrolase family 43 protein [Draconibacterium sediminis]|uniref:glycoside hydrolase family 43 protein n=1 Tax=Draconibacterium sediminis TaxID=1544798 RepID=UPI0026F1D193|nr:glycoside hydrolase family 43 protein [Draconibacterium sediminis]
MQLRIYITMFLLVMVFCACAKGENLPGEIDSGETPDQIKNQTSLALGDPYIFYYDNRYYAYGTQSPNGIVVYVSDDLETWRVPAEANNGLALHKDDVYADRWFWAPEVYFVNNKFYMYYSADEHICVATSDSPLGPFKQEIKKPMIENEKCIDNSLFIDEDGKAYLSFVRFTDGNAIWIAELEEDFTTLKMETLKPCLNVLQNWEKAMGRVNEGSFIVKHNGIYYMSYSANHYESPMYGVGYATAENVMGPWEKSAMNPILQKPKGLTGVGHSAMFWDKNGDLRIVFHSHNSNTKIHPRLMHIGRVNFENVNGEEVMQIGDDILTPVLKEE